MKTYLLVFWLGILALTNTAHAALYQITSSSLKFDAATFSVSPLGIPLPIVYSLEGVLDIQLGNATSFETGAVFQTIVVHDDAIVTDTPSDREFSIPQFTGFFQGNDFGASFCASTHVLYGGSCFQPIDFSHYSGTLIGNNLEISGSVLVDDFHAYEFEISANQVPVPTSLFLYISSLLAALCARCVRKS